MIVSYYDGATRTTNYVRATEIISVSDRADTSAIGQIMDAIFAKSALCCSEDELFDELRKAGDGVRGVTFHP